VLRRNFALAAATALVGAGFAVLPGVAQATPSAAPAGPQVVTTRTAGALLAAPASAGLVMQPDFSGDAYVNE
jgi:hypothetical protein